MTNRLRNVRTSPLNPSGTTTPHRSSIALAANPLAPIINDQSITLISGTTGCPAQMSGSQFWQQKITAHCRRRRRRDDNSYDEDNYDNNVEKNYRIPIAITTTATTVLKPPADPLKTHLVLPAALHKHSEPGERRPSPTTIQRPAYNANGLTGCRHILTDALNCYSPAFGGRWATALAYMTLLILTTTTTCWGTASPCDMQSWWDPIKDKCIACTICQGEMIPLRPCQLHRDTICGSIYDLKIDWVVLAKTEPNWKERRKIEDGEYNLEHQLTQEQLQQLHDEGMPMDWQTGALFMAVVACLVFFIAAACILIHHMRQWRRMERRLDQDVEELSTKLMAKLAEVQSLEGGTFFIGNADALRVPTTFQPQHVLLPQEKPGKHHDRRILKALQPGNVYIEESSSKG